jgi:hypothetical protein
MHVVHISYENNKNCSVLLLAFFFGWLSHFLLLLIPLLPLVLLFFKLEKGEQVWEIYETNLDWAAAVVVVVRLHWSVMNFRVV